MRVLALDTSLAAVQAAVVDDGRVLALSSEAMVRGHQERLAPLVSETLARAATRPGQVERVVTTVGPGSFTGLRMGLAFAKAFALALGVPCSGVGTLEALAASAGEDADLAACIGAPRDRVYLQTFREGLAAMPPRLLTVDEAAGQVAGLRVVGPGAATLGASHAIAWPDIVAVARLGVARLIAPDPIYLREVGALTIAERRSAAAP